MQKEFDYLVVGAGLCGLVLAKELSKRNKKVLILEKGSFINKLGTVGHAAFIYDKFGFARSAQGVLIYRGFGVGGTSIISCGNAVNFTNEEYDRVGIDFKRELAEAKKESCVREKLAIGKTSSRIFEVANKLGYTMVPMPKFSITGRCAFCGDCYLGCRYGTKWTSRECLTGINKINVDLITEFSVVRIIDSNGKAVGVEGIYGKISKKNTGAQSRRKQKFFADKIILSAGGIGTPIILQNSGTEAGDQLFVDLFNVTYGETKEFNQRKELTMSIVCDKFHQHEGFVLSPFVDCWLSFCSSAELRHLLNTFKINRLMGIMTKIVDEDIGKVHRNGKIDKTPTDNDIRKLKKGSDIAREILIKCGVKPKSIFVTKPRGAHPGGTAGIGRVVDKNLETKKKNLYVCDASVLPFAPGLPPMLSLIALAKWFGKNIE